MENVILIQTMFLQRKYILKFATDGAILTKTKNAVQGTMKLIPCDDKGKVMLSHPVYSKLDKEITLYYFIGNVINYFCLSSSFRIKM